MRQVLHLTDTHLVAEDPPQDRRSFTAVVAELQGRPVTELLGLVIDEVLAQGFRPDLVLHTGDGTDDGTRASTEQLRDALASLDVPVVVVPGNHDRSDVVAEVFGHVDAPVRAVDLAPWQVIAIDTSGLGREHGDLDPAALQALDETLGSASGPVLVGLHHPPISTCPDPYCQLVAAEALLAVIDRHPRVRAVASGHLHVTHELRRGDVRYLLSPSTALQLRHEHPLADHNRHATPVGARLITLHDDGTVSSTLVWVGDEGAGTVLS